jgi:hypothetical protein
MIYQQRALLKVVVPITFFMLIISTIDYLSRFGFSFDLPPDDLDSIKNMVELLVRIIFTFTIVFWGTIAILKPNHASCILLIAYLEVCILLQVINFKFLSQFDEVDDLIMFKTRN